MDACGVIVLGKKLCITPPFADHNYGTELVILPASDHGFIAQGGGVWNELNQQEALNDRLLILGKVG